MINCDWISFYFEQFQTKGSTNFTDKFYPVSSIYRWVRRRIKKNNSKLLHTLYTLFYSSSYRYSTYSTYIYSIMSGSRLSIIFCACLYVSWSFLSALIKVIVYVRIIKFGGIRALGYGRMNRN